MEGLPYTGKTDRDSDSCVYRYGYINDDEIYDAVSVCLSIGMFVYSLYV